MLPHLKHGKIVVGRAWFQKLSNRDVIIFRHGGKEKIKRIRCFSGGWLEVHGDNPQSSTDSRHFGMIPPGTVLAKVIWPRNKRSN